MMHIYFGTLEIYADFIHSILSLPQPSADFALDALAGEFVSSTAASTVKSAACVPTETAQEVNTRTTQAFFGLSKTLQLHYNLFVCVCAISCPEEQAMPWMLCQTP